MICRLFGLVTALLFPPDNNKVPSIVVFQNIEHSKQNILPPPPQRRKERSHIFQIKEEFTVFNNKMLECSVFHQTMERSHNNIITGILLPFIHTKKRSL